MTILFDLDGTLINSTEAILESFGIAYEAFGMLKPKDEHIIRQIGNPLSIMFERTGAPNAINSDMVTRYKTHYKTIATNKTYLLECAKSAIDEASNFAALGVVTTKTSAYSNDILEHLGILKYFETVVGFDDVINPKPHPEPIFTALKRMGKERNENCFMIGDTRLDVEAANAAGISHIAVYSGYESKESLEAVSSVIEKDALEAVLRIKNNGR